MRAEHGRAFWATLTGYLSIWLATWIDDIRPLGGRYSSLDVDDGRTRQVEADFLGLGGNAGRLNSFPAFLFGFPPIWFRFRSRTPGRRRSRR